MMNVVVRADGRGEQVRIAIHIAKISGPINHRGNRAGTIHQKFIL